MKARNLLVVIHMTVALGTLSGTAANALADEYKVDARHSTVIFRVKHNRVSYFYGRFNEIKGGFTFDEADPTSLALDVEIKTESIDTNDKKRDEHLKGPDFFNAKRYKTITFKSTKVKQGKDNTHRVTGDLTLRGVTKSITVDVVHVGSGSDSRGRHLAGFETSFTIKRSDFGMDYMVGGLGDDIRIMVGLEGVRRKPGP
jgi:polyisoprenoid-binding protein YceI